MAGCPHCGCGCGAKPLEKQILDRIQILEQKGLIDHHFRLCHSLKESNGVFFFLELIPIFLTDTKTTVRDITKALDQPVVDFDSILNLCMKLIGSSACIGACRMKNVCSNIRQGIEIKSKDRILLALNDIKQEYRTLETELGSIMQLEKELVDSRT